jgi:hypothetical protein
MSSEAPLLDETFGNRHRTRTSDHDSALTEGV